MAALREAGRVTAAMAGSRPRATPPGRPMPGSARARGKARTLSSALSLAVISLLPDPQSFQIILSSSLTPCREVHLPAFLEM